MPFLEIKGLTYTYPGETRPALNGVALDADRGSLVAIVGPNASGKSTLARAVKGLIAPQMGEIVLDGVPVRGGSPDRRVGFLLSNPENQLITSIVEEDVAFGMETLGAAPSAIRDAVDRTLETLGIAHLRRAMPHRLSGGEQQMVALAGALAPDPDILVLDEPTTYLDPHGRRSVLEALDDIVRRGKTVLFITHDMEEASRADRIALLQNGRVERVSGPREFFEDEAVLHSARLRQPFPWRLSGLLKAAGIDIRDASSHVDVLIPELLELVGEKAVSSIRRDASVAEVRELDGNPMALQFQGVGFRYGVGGTGDGNVLDGLNLEVPRESLSVLCGANGAGKSTLLQISNGLLEPSSGRVLINGKTIAETGSLAGGIPSRVALLFQNPERQVFADTVYDDIAFGPRNLGRTEGEVRDLVAEAVMWVGLSDDILTRSPFHLSGGQLRRTAVAGIIAMASDILVLDEPTDGLDPAGAEEFMTRVDEYISRTGSTVLLATHRVPEQMAGVDLLAALEHGRVTGCGTPREVLFSPDHPLSKEFFPSHIRVQLELLERGFDIGDPSVNADEAARSIVRALGLEIRN